MALQSFEKDKMKENLTPEQTEANATNGGGGGGLILRAKNIYTVGQMWSPGLSLTRVVSVESKPNCGKKFLNEVSLVSISNRLQISSSLEHFPTDRNQTSLTPCVPRPSVKDSTGSAG